MKTLKFSTAILLALLGVFVLSGCGAGTQEVDQGYVQKSTENAKLARSIFDANKGQWDSVSAADKKKLAEAYGSDANAKKVWDLMVAPPAGGVAPGPK